MSLHPGYSFVSQAFSLWRPSRAEDISLDRQALSEIRELYGFSKYRSKQLNLSKFNSQVQATSPSRQRLRKTFLTTPTRLLCCPPLCFAVSSSNRCTFKTPDNASQGQNLNSIHKSKCKGICKTDLPVLWPARYRKTLAAD